MDVIYVSKKNSLAYDKSQYLNGGVHTIQIQVTIPVRDRSSQVVKAQTENSQPTHSDCVTKKLLSINAEIPTIV